MDGIDNYISVAEYAMLHGVTHEAIKKRCQRGCFLSARKIGHNWVIDKTEPFTDGRVTTGKYRNWRKTGG